MFSIPLFLVVLAAQQTTVPAGTRVEARLESAVRSNGSAVGDNVTAVLRKPILVGGLQFAAPGNRLYGRVETIQPATLSNPGRFRLVFREMELPDGRHTQTWITTSFAGSPPRRTLHYVLYPTAGAVAGAFIGGTAARAAAVLGGGLIGFLIATNSGDGKQPDVDLKPGRILHLQLGENMTVPTKR
jgi:hypothetical protein